MNRINRSISLLLGRFGEAQDEHGQTLAEYSLMVTLVAVGVVAVAVFLFSAAIASTYDSVTACLSRGCS